MHNSEKDVLERHLQRLSAEVDALSSEERRIRTESMRIQLLENNVEIDKKVNDAIEAFNNKLIGCEELFIALQGKIPIP
jgi:hypothetical protein